MNSICSTTVLPSDPAAKRAARQREVETALLVQALCVQPSTSAVKAQLARYVVGELSREEAFAGLYQGLC
jgi:hypothetical protein